MRFAQCGAVEKDCNSVLLDAIQEKTYTANTAQPEAAELRLDECEYIPCAFLSVTK